MEKAQWLTAALLAVALIGLPVGVIVLVGQADQPTDCKYPRDNYPDEHLGI